MSDNRMDRRQLLGRGAAIGALAALSTEALFAAEASAGYKATSAYKGTLRVVGLGVDLIPQIQKAYESTHPGVKLRFTVKDTPGIGQAVLTQPKTQDIMSGYYHQLDQVWPSGNLIPIPVSQVTAWSSISRLIKQGSLKPGGTPGQGDAPFRKIFLDSSKKKFATGATNWLTMIPGNHNSDSFGYNEKEVGGTLDSWAALFDTHFSGHVALIVDPDIGFIDAGMAAKASGKMTMKDLGNPTKKEIDDLTTILKDLKKAGHFKAFWSTFQESVTFMQTGAVVVESMWSPAVTLLQEAQFPVRYAAPKEGFRGWGGGNAILKHVQSDPDKLAAAYDYLNWWNTPVPAGIMATQGYYNANISASHKGLASSKALGGTSADNYWLKGKAATAPLVGPDGKPGITVGSTRDGGSYESRSGRFYAWNSQGTNRDYLLQKWQEFISA
jgi:putative spermidine/putrescine transport system substrate-binding protein